METLTLARDNESLHCGRGRSSGMEYWQAVWWPQLSQHEVRARAGVSAQGPLQIGTPLTLTPDMTIRLTRSEAICRLVLKLVSQLILYSALRTLSINDSLHLMYNTKSVKDKTGNLENRLQYHNIKLWKKEEAHR